MPQNGDIGMVCFDVGGVLVRICRGWAEGCAAAGLPVHPGPDRPELKLRRRELSTAYQSGLMGFDEFCLRMSEATGGLYSAHQVELIHDAWLLCEYPGVAAVVDRLASLKHVSTGVLSNTNERHWERLTCAPFSSLSRLGHRHASHLLRMSKPSAEIYRHFARATGFGQTPGRILFFDDLAENVEGARAAGWRAELIDHSGDTAAQISLHLERHGVFASAGRTPAAQPRTGYC